MSATSIIPAGEYLCIWYMQENAPEKSAEINRYCEQHRITPALVVQAELLNDIFSTDSPAVELQLLIAKKQYGTAEEIIGYDQNGLPS